MNHTYSAPEKPISMLPLAVTMGDINGVGPEILVKALSRPDVRAAGPFIVFGSEKIFTECRTFASECPPAVTWLPGNPVPPADEAVPVVDCGCGEIVRAPGKLDGASGQCAAVWIEEAVKACMAGWCAGMVTCPVNKEGLRLGGCAYDGHTPYIAHLTGCENYWMSLFSPRMRVIHITAHLSLRQALDAVRKERIVDAVNMAGRALTRLGIAAPRIAVAGLNPHAGENGAFGQEELDEIAPAVLECRRQGWTCSGPWPPDTVFLRMYLGEFDAVIAMYHDQGHIAVKLVAMDEGVNVTLGLPIVRTSPDHGTAYDLAGTGQARENSLVAAIQLARQLSAPLVLNEPSISGMEKA